jgi:choline transport protein
LNALGLVSVVSFLLSIIYVISTTAFNAIISLQTISLSVSYIPPILFFMLRKIRGQHIPYGPFKLGRYGIATNVLALAYLLYVVIWMPFPTMLPVTGSNMNYAGPLLSTVIVGALVDWTFSGHKRFKVPVAQSWTM